MCFLLHGIRDRDDIFKATIAKYTAVHTHPNTHTPPTQTSKIKSLILSSNAKYNKYMTVRCE